MTLPRVQPIIPTSRKQPFDDPGWLFEFKYDGFRALCYLEAGRCLLVSRNGNHLARFDELGAELGGLLDLDEAILDGEVIAADATGRPQFYELLRRTAGTCLCCLRHSMGRWHRPAGLAAQQAPAASARHCAKRISDPVRGSVGRGPRTPVLRSGAAHDLEGIVATRLSDPYEPRTRWLKIKNPDYTQKEGRSELFNGSRSAR